MKKQEILEFVEDKLQGDLGYRGGSLFIHKEQLEDFTGLDFEATTKIGCYCNYLGGGVRGSILKSEYRETRIKQKRILEYVLKFIENKYKEYENEQGLEDDNLYCPRVEMARAY